MITSSFQVQLESARQWDRWMVKLERQIQLIVGSQRIPLYYLIKENDAPDQTECDTQEEKAVLAVPLTGRLYKKDNLTVQNIILHKITDESDAFTYVKP